MRIVLYGATGRAGSRILTELLSRGHEVVAVVRNLDRDPDKLAPNDGLTVQQGDLSRVEAIVEAIGGAQAVVSAYGPPADKPGQLIDVTKREIAAVHQVSEQANSPEHAPRLVVVGGAGSRDDVRVARQASQVGHVDEVVVDAVTERRELLVRHVQHRA